MAVGSQPEIESTSSILSSNELGGPFVFFIVSLVVFFIVLYIAIRIPLLLASCLKGCFENVKSTFKYENPDEETPLDGLLETMNTEIINAITANENYKDPELENNRIIMPFGREAKLDFQRPSRKITELDPNPISNKDFFLKIADVLTKNQ